MSRTDRGAVWLRVHMLHKGLTAVALAKLAGISQHTVAAWRCGARRPSEAMRKRLARALRVATWRIKAVFGEEAQQ